MKRRERKKKEGDLENLETETDEDRDDEGDEDGDGNDNNEGKKKSPAPDERRRASRAGEEAASSSPLADHSSLVTRIYEVADNLLTLLEGNMGSMEALAYFSTEADAYNNKEPRSTPK